MASAGDARDQIDPNDALLDRLAEPIPEDLIRWRQDGKGNELPYVKAKTIMDILDGVCGPSNWWLSYTPVDQAVICKLTVLLPDGRTITKENASGYPPMTRRVRGAEQEDVSSSRKGGYTIAFVRAATMFGIARHLPPPRESGRGGQSGYGERRPATSPGRRDSGHDPRNAHPQQQPHGPSREDGHGHGDGQNRNYGSPRTGKALYAWVKAQEQELDAGLLAHLNTWAKQQGFPYKMTEYSQDQVTATYAEAQRRLQGTTVPANRGDGYEDDDPGY